MSLPTNPSLPSTPGGNAREVDNMARLDSQIILPSSLRGEVCSLVGLGLPHVPDCDIGEVVTSDGDARLSSVLENNWLVDRNWSVDAICLIGNGHSIRLLRDYFVGLRLILVRAAFKARDGGLGNVLVSV